MGRTWWSRLSEADFDAPVLLETADMETKESTKAAYERSDVCAVPAGGIVGEAMVILELAVLSSKSLEHRN